MNRSYEPDADRALAEPGRFDLVSEDALWRAYQFACSEGWGLEFLIDHEDHLPPSMRRVLVQQRLERVRRTADSVLKREVA